MEEGILKNIFDSKSKTFLVFCFCFLLGVLALSFRESRIEPVFLWTAMFVNSIFVFLFWKNRLLKIFLCACLCIVLGLLRMDLIIPSRANTDISFYQGTKIQLKGFIASEPDIRQDGVAYIVRVQERDFSSGKKDVSGKVFLKLPLYPRYVYGQNLNLNCTLTKPQATEDFRYDKYLATKRVFTLCDFPHVDKENGNSGNFMLRKIYLLKNSVAQKINLLWHEPYASFVAGLLYGYRGGLGTLNDDFNRTGVTHIVAVSGFNITIIATVLSSLLLFFLVPRRSAFWLVVGGICLFVLFTGASASVVRAGIMGILALLSRQLGRSSRIQNVLVFTVVLMTLHNPFILIWDLGFQLSFLSTCGLVYLSPLLEKYCSKIPTFLNVRESLVSTLSAIIFTLPLILFQFGRLSLVAPLVNLLILPLIPIMMALGFLSVLLAFIFWPLAKLCAFLTYIGLAYIVHVVQFFSGLPFAAIELPLPFSVMIFCYIFFIFIIKKYSPQKKFIKN